MGGIESLSRGHVDVRQKSFTPGSMALDAATLNAEPGQHGLVLDEGPFSGSVKTPRKNELWVSAWAFVTNLLTQFGGERILPPLNTSQGLAASVPGF